MGIYDFLMENTIDNYLEKDVLVSTRFKDENGEILKFKIKTLASKEIAEIEKRAKQNGTLQTVLIIETACLEPNFKSVELQNKYGVYGAENLINKILLAGEIATLSDEILKLNGFGKTFEEVFVEAKKY